MLMYSVKENSTFEDISGGKEAAFGEGFDDEAVKKAVRVLQFAARENGVFESVIEAEDLYVLSLSYNVVLCLKDKEAFLESFKQREVWRYD